MGVVGLAEQFAASGPEVDVVDTRNMFSGIPDVSRTNSRSVANFDAAQPHEFEGAAFQIKRPPSIKSLCHAQRRLVAVDCRLSAVNPRCHCRIGRLDLTNVPLPAHALHELLVTGTSTALRTARVVPNFDEVGFQKGSRHLQRARR